MKEFSFDKRINIFCGHYGSGKSEISVNAAFMLKQKASKVLMADMDVVNPYYRSADARKALEDEGIKVVAPLFANTNVDVPAIGPEISIGLKDKSHNVIIDVGGDEDGSRVLGRYYHEIVKNEYDMFFVFNRSRPMTVNFEETLSYIREIEAASRLKITGLINNTHFLDQTTVEDIMYGLELAQEISQETLIPIRATCVMEGLEKQLEGELDHPLMVLRKRLSLPF